MSEQQQQDEASGHHIHINATIDKEPTQESNNAAKMHKARRRHKRHEKDSFPHKGPDTQQASDVDIEDMTSEDSALYDTHLSIEKDDDTEKTPAIVVAAKKVTTTPLPPLVEEVSATETVLDTPLPDSLTEEETGCPQGDALVPSQPISSARMETLTETILDTPLPLSINETDAVSPPIDETDTLTPDISATEEPVVPTTPAVIEDTVIVPPAQKQPRPTRRIQFVYALLALLLICTFLLWQDLTATHLYINTIDAKSGSIRTQQDLGGYHDAIHLTAPLASHTTSPVVLGVYANDVSGTQQIVTLTNTASTLSLQHSTSLANGAITYAANGNLLVESANGLQVMAQDGQMIWQVQGTQPTHGVHHFQPVSDTQTVYTIKSVIHSQIAAYDLTNGHAHWSQTLPDTLEYTPPFLLDGGTLYVASDHNIFALNSGDGSILWEKSYATRTLLLENEEQNHLLIALGAQGIQALQSDTGDVVWWFRGDPDVSTLPTQFYQGSIGSIQAISGNSIYATGVVWQMPQVRESVWLYAIDATTGKMRWSQRLASGLVSVDAGRGLQPLLDVNNGRVVVQRAISREERDVTAYDANTGTQRWNTPLEDRNTSSPIVFQVSQGTFALFTTTTNSTTILWTPSLYRTCILLLLLVSTVGLLSFLLRKRERIQRIARSTAARFTPIRRRWRYAYTFFILALLFICIGVSVFAYIYSKQPVRQTLTTDVQGSMVVTDTSDNMHQLEALNPNGTTQWKLFTSEGVFSLPNAHVQAGTLLVALHGHIAGSYLVAEDDPAYPRPLDTMLALYLLNRSTGHALWQQVVSYPDEQQDTEVIGADATYIYIAGEHVVTASTQTDAKSIQTTQLFAVNNKTGTVDWRIFGPPQSNPRQHVHSVLLLKNGLAFWHVATPFSP